MKAEDTVMEYSERFKCRDRIDLCKTQAELSFNAGVKEVVDWMKSHMTFMEWEYKDSKGVWDCPVDDIEWQSKLKDWGIEDKRNS